GVIPPHIPVQPNPKLRGTCLRLPSRAGAWPSTFAARRVAVSSFGLGGANSHLVIGSIEESERVQTTVAFSGPRGAGVAIMSLDATMGRAHGSNHVRELFTKTDEKHAFPWHRFSMDLARKKADRVHGSFFPAELPVEANGLRMGPKGLARLDAFQR